MISTELSFALLVYPVKNPNIYHFANLKIYL